MSVVVNSRNGPDPMSLKSLRRMPHAIAVALRLLWQSHPPSLVWAISLHGAAGAGIGLQLLVGRRVIDAVLNAARVEAGLGEIGADLALLVGITAAVALAEAAASSTQRLLLEHALRHVQARTLDAAAAVDLEEYESSGFFDKLTRAQQEGMMAPIRIAMGLTAVASALVGAAGILVALASIQPLLVPLVIVGYFPLWIATTMNSGDSFEFAFGQTSNDRMRQALTRVLTGKASAAEVRAFGLIGFLRHRWDELAKQRVDEARRLTGRSIRRSGAGGIMSAVLTAATLLEIVWMPLRGRVDVAGAATAAIALQQLGQRLSSMGGGVGQLYEASLFLDDTMAFMEEAAKQGALGSDLPDSPAGFTRLVATGVEFSYPGTSRKALEGVDLEIHAGEVVALVGENGSGKTTLAKILSGLYRPQNGSVSWDGVDVSGCNGASVRRNVAVTFQDFVRYPLPAAENIGVGSCAHIGDREAVVAAARHAGIDGVIDGLHAGYDTVLSKEFDGGEDLSVGQWQRVALARSFFRDAPFVVLDEPTAALDPRAEHDLFLKIRDLFHGRSVLLISHRFSSVRMADRIYVLHEGKVVESGTHAELMALRGRYAEMFTFQAQAYLEEGKDDRPPPNAGGPPRVLLAQ